VWQENNNTNGQGGSQQTGGGVRMQYRREQCAGVCRRWTKSNAMTNLGNRSENASSTTSTSTRRLRFQHCCRSTSHGHCCDCCWHSHSHCCCYSSCRHRHHCRRCCTPTADNNRTTDNGPFAWLSPPVHLTNGVPHALKAVLIATVALEPVCKADVVQGTDVLRQEPPAASASRDWCTKKEIGVWSCTHQIRVVI
jgi:hypothetical protein